MALTTAASTQLGCGRDIDQVWDHLDRAPDAHELTCPYCQAARADLRDLTVATRQLREAEATNPDLRPRPQVLDRVLAVAHAEVRRGRRLPLDRPGLDGTSPNTVSEQTVTAVVRRVGDRDAHVQIRRCSITADRSERAGTASGTTSRPTERADLAGGPAAGVRDPGPTAVTVVLRVSVARDLAIVDASRRLRGAVVEAVAQEVGMHVSRVHINVEDLHDA